MPTKKKKARGGTRSFKLVPKEEAARQALEALKVDIFLLGDRAIVLPRPTPRGGGCGPFTGGTSCRAASFFDKVVLD